MLPKNYYKNIIDITLVNGVKKSSWVFIYLASGHTFDWMMPRRNRRHLDKRKRKKKDLLTFLTHNS